MSHAPDQGVCSGCGERVYLRDGVYVSMTSKTTTCTPATPSEEAP